MVFDGACFLCWGLWHPTIGTDLASTTRIDLRRHAAAMRLACLALSAVVVREECQRRSSRAVNSALRPQQLPF